MAKPFFALQFNSLFSLSYVDEGQIPTTLEILEILKNIISKIIFSNCQKHPQITKRIFKEGHIIGNHLLIIAFLFHFFISPAILKIIKKQNLIFVGSTAFSIEEVLHKNEKL